MNGPSFDRGFQARAAKPLMKKPGAVLPAMMSGPTGLIEIGTIRHEEGWEGWEGWEWLVGNGIDNPRPEIKNPRTLMVAGFRDIARSFFGMSIGEEDYQTNPHNPLPTRKSSNTKPNMPPNLPPNILPLLQQMQMLDSKQDQTSLKGRQSPVRCEKDTFFCAYTNLGHPHKFPLGSADSRGKHGACIHTTSPCIIVRPLDELSDPPGAGYRRMIVSCPAQRTRTPDEVGNAAALSIADSAFITVSAFLMDGWEIT